MAQKAGARPIHRVKIYLTATQDVTDYYMGGASFDIEKQREKSVSIIGDVTLTLSNHDQKFSPEVTTSIFYNEVYHDKKVTFEIGYLKDDGTTEYEMQATMRIKDIEIDTKQEVCYIYCQDIMRKVINGTLNLPSSALIPVADAANVGNGYITDIKTKPFVMTSETWYLTCTLGGNDGVATFSVVGSGSGNIGTATSGTEFSNAVVGGIKFTIWGGAFNWVIGDEFTFNTRDCPGWSNTNLGEILWSLLTGYNYATDTTDPWYEASLKLDHTQGAGNTDIDYAVFQTAVLVLIGMSCQLTGYIPYYKSASEAIEELCLMCLGSVFVKSDGKICFIVFKPSLGTTRREFSYLKKVSRIKPRKRLSDIINYGSCKFKKKGVWSWSDTEETTDGEYIYSNSTSITNYGRHTYEKILYWIPAVNVIEYFLQRIIDIYNTPPLDIEFDTGLDALQTALNDRIELTDSKLNYVNKILEVNRIQKNFEFDPRKITITALDNGTTGINWCFLGSSANETDHDWTPAASQNWDTATNFERQFVYLSQTGGSGGAGPDYFLW